MLLEARWNVLTSWALVAMHTADLSGEDRLTTLHQTITISERLHPRNSCAQSCEQYQTPSIPCWLATQSTGFGPAFVAFKEHAVTHARGSRAALQHLQLALSVVPLFEVLPCLCLPTNTLVVANNDRVQLYTYRRHNFLPSN